MAMTQGQEESGSGSSSRGGGNSGSFNELMTYLSEGLVVDNSEMFDLVQWWRLVDAFVGTRNFILDSIGSINLGVLVDKGQIHKGRGSMLLRVVVVSFVFLSLLNNGNAGITSTFIRSEWPSTDIPIDNEAFSIPKAHNAPQQVHITQADYDGRAVIISWVTPDAPGSNKVQYGTAEKRYEFTAEGTVSNYTFYQYKSGYIHHCLVDGLEYDTKYYYKLGSGDSAREFWFETPPKIDPDAPYKFGIIGDLGQTYNSLSTLEHYIQSGGQTVLFLGDLSYADRYQYNDVGLRWDSWGRFVERSTSYQPWIWSAGNHEIDYMPYMYRISNIHYNITSGDRYPVPDKSAPVYITVGDGGNQEGLAGRFLDPQPDYSAFREASYGHSTLEIKNRTHAFYHWNRNDDGKKSATDAFVLRNQYW
ncbi:Bifunctional purple acid phosphatase 26 [Morus notabilis]|uniref:acid phosphatase n=1 Tax=Morus notabilis TaxID=981085 RepID=W9RDX2_9ROSA|nr:Bifunctional purple acid phosphatase 26 [Morus notabilis]